MSPSSESLAAQRTERRPHAVHGGDKGCGRFIVLDAMRGLAAVIVLLFHGANLFPSGYAAVDFFFVLSGFVLAHRYGDGLKDTAGRLAFARQRIVRLYPLYLVGMLLGMAGAGLMLGRVAGWTPSVFAGASVLGPLFLPTPANTPLGLFPFDGPAWSLFCEALVNIVFAFIGTRVRLAAALAALAAPFVLLAISRWYAGGGSTLEDWPGGLARVTFSFFTGVVVYRLWQSGIRMPWQVPAPLLLAALLALYWCYPSWNSRYDGLLVVLAHPLLVWIAAGSAPGRMAPVYTWLGAISYALYIVQVPILFFVSLLLRDDRSIGVYLDTPLLNERPAPPFPMTWIALPLAVFAAHLLTVHVDPRLRRWLDARLLRLVQKRGVSRRA